MKVLKAIKHYLIVAIVCVYFVFVVAMTLLVLNFNDYGVTQYGEKSLAIINSNIANDNYKKGDLVVVKSAKLENLKVGEELFTYAVDAKGVVSIDLGKIGKVYPDENAVSFENGKTYGMDFIMGVPEKTYEDVGGFLSIVESKWGFLFLVLVPSFMIFIYQVYALIVEIKYGEEE